jgi:hypothetical protein
VLESSLTASEDGSSSTSVLTYEGKFSFLFYQCIVVNREVLESSLTASEDGTSSSTSVLTIKPKREDDGEQFLCQVKKRDCLSRS